MGKGISTDPITESWQETARTYTPIYRSTISRAAGGALTLYTVPAGRTLFVTNAGISMYYNAGGTTSVAMLRFDDSGGTEQLDLACHMYAGPVAGQKSDEKYVVFELPIKLTAGSTVSVPAFGGGAIVDVYFSGWLE